MKIVVTDGYTLNPGDLSWDCLSSLGEVAIFDRTSPAQVVDRCLNASIILTNKVPFNRQTIEQLPSLKLIAVTATGYNVIDTAAAREQKIVVCNVPGYGTPSVAQHVFALLLELTNGVGKHAASVAEGCWQKSPDWCYSLQPVMELNGKTLGIVGYGSIGRQVASIAAAFGMKVIYYSPTPKGPQIGSPADLETLFASSDVVSLHCPLKHENDKFVNKRLLQLMKPSAFLINTARGQLINEADLADALNNKVLAAAALDVLSVEPPSQGNPLLKARNCLITPHIAWISKEARQRIMDISCSNVKAFINGCPENQVN